MKNEKKIKNSNFIDACYNAVNGIIYATTTQSNIKKQLIITVIVLILSLFLELTRVEFLILTFAIVLVLLMEMVNTAVETVVDLYVDVYHPKAKIAKDVAAGGVVIASLNSIIVGYFLFFEKIGSMGSTVLKNIVESPLHLAFTAIVLTIIAVVSIKATSVKNKNKIKLNFCPSGQVAIAFAALTTIWLTTSDIVILTLSLVLSILVAENRIESNNKTLAETFFSACMGVLIVVLVYSLLLLK